MKNKRYAAILVLIAAMVGASTAPAQTRRSSSSDRQTRTLLNRLSTRTNTFQNALQRRSEWNVDRPGEDRLSDLLTTFSNSLNSLRSSVATRTNSSDEMSSLLNRASRINLFLDRHPMGTSITNQWASIRRDVNTLAGDYQIAWNWNQPYPENGRADNDRRGGLPVDRLDGTYRLSRTQSENLSSVIDRSVGVYSASERANMRRRLERRLTPPEMIAIDANGRSITMASSNARQVTFDADGVTHSETNNRGRTVTTRVTPTNDGFTIAYEGDRASDFNVAFMGERNGRLRVTRTVYLEGRDTPVTVTSLYDRINGTAQWSMIPEPQNRGSNWNGSRSGNSFYIPNGVNLTARLRNPINTSASQIGDRFTMEVTSPSQYRGAVIEGHVDQVANSGRFTGRANIQLDFDTLTMNGRSYPFSGIVESVNTVNGDSVTVNNEGTIRDSSQGNVTAQRAGIGAVLGGLIGAIAGGGEGAAIGAGVGAGVGAGSVLASGRDRIELGAGSTFRITATAPGTAEIIRHP